MNNDDGTAVENMAADNDQDDIAKEHQAKNTDSPGMAAKKARLRSNMSKLKGKAPAAPKPQGAPMPQGSPLVPDDPTNIGEPDPSISPMSAVSKPSFDPIASVKKAMRGAQGSGNAGMLRRFNEHLKSQRGRRP